MKKLFIILFWSFCPFWTLINFIRKGIPLFSSRKSLVLLFTIAICEFVYIGIPYVIWFFHSLMIDLNKMIADLNDFEVEISLTNPLDKHYPTLVLALSICLIFRGRLNFIFISRSLKNKSDP